MNITFEAAKPRVNWARNINNTEYPVSEKLKAKIASAKDALEILAKEEKTNITIAQKGDLLLINSRATTSVVDHTKLEDDFDVYEMFLKHVIRSKNALRSGIHRNI